MPTRIGAFVSSETQEGSAAGSVPKVASAGFGGVQGANPVRRGDVVTSGAGFGLPTVTKPQAEPQPVTRAGGFGSVSGQAASDRRQAEPARASDVEIIHKPRPSYTEEARRLKIEGEVLVEVVFTASGDVKVLRVVKGLGHGLDEAAVQAAANIRFKPAEREGRAVDSAAIARIKFSLAY